MAIAEARGQLTSSALSVVEVWFDFRPAPLTSGPPPPIPSGHPLDLIQMSGQMSHGRGWPGGVRFLLLSLEVRCLIAQVFDRPTRQ